MTDGRAAAEEVKDDGFRITGGDLNQVPQEFQWLRIAEYLWAEYFREILRSITITSVFFLHQEAARGYSI
jgi:hypothetical protein